MRYIQPPPTPALGCRAITTGAVSKTIKTNHVSLWRQDKLVFPESHFPWRLRRADAVPCQDFKEHKPHQQVGKVLTEAPSRPWTVGNMVVPYVRL